MGAKRAAEVARSQDSCLVSIVDKDEERALTLAREFRCQAGTNWEKWVASPLVDAVVVATTHKWLGPIALAALDAGRHVLCEKPLAMTPEEAESLVKCAARKVVKLKTGFNHRHHPAIWEAHSMAESGRIGRLLFIRCRYGHGGRWGYEKEWRADPSESGGGELLDQGIHAMDLFRWFLGEFSNVWAVTSRAFWPIPVEDNAFCTLQTSTGQVATLHASWTQWKNLFSFEVFGENGYLIVEGLGGYYGKERLVAGRRNANFGVPTEEVFDFPEEDSSWREEWKEFITAIKEDRTPLASGYDGWQALRLASAAYESARGGRPITLD